MGDDAGEAALDREVEDIGGVAALRVLEEIDRSVLDPVVVGEEQQGTVRRSSAVEQPRHARLLAGAQAQFFQGRALDRGFLHHLSFRVATAPA